MGGGWRWSLLFSCLLVLLFRKKQVPQQPPEQCSVNRVQKDTEPRAASQALPPVHISRGAVGPECRSLLGEPGQPASIFAISQLPWPSSGSKISTVRTTGSLLCKHAGIDEWNLKRLSLRPRVWTRNLVWINSLRSLFA